MYDRYNSLWGFDECIVTLKALYQKLTLILVKIVPITLEERTFAMVTYSWLLLRGTAPGYLRNLDTCRCSRCIRWRENGDRGNLPKSLQSEMTSTVPHQHKVHRTVNHWHIQTNQRRILILAEIYSFAEYLSKILFYKDAWEDVSKK